MRKYEKILELDKIILKLQNEVVTNKNYEIINDYFHNEDSLLSDNYLEIEEMLNQTDEAAKIIQRMGRFPLLFDTNIDFYINKATKNGILQIDEILEIGKLLDTVKNIIIFNETLVNNQIDNYHFNCYVNQINYPKDLNLKIKNSINNFGEVLDSASPNLEFIRRSIRNTEKGIQAKLHEIVSKNSSKLSQSTISIRNDRYVIPVKNDFKNSVKGIIHDESASGETVFIEPAIICEMNNQLNKLKEEEKKEIYRILKELTSIIGSYSEVLLIDFDIIVRLDLIFSKANLSLKYNGNKPKINDQGRVEMLACYHPLLNVEKIITNNIFIGKDYQGIIITGPNTGGKTVLLKTIGLLSLMIKMGLLVPCSSESDLAIFDDVFADIGDEQSIDQNLSTFSSHLKNVNEIMNLVNQNSLVLLDELGSGTDPQEGAALAIAIFDYLINRNSLVIASSHYAELKIHAYENPKIINASVEFNAETLRPTYKLLIGVPGESNALKISKILGLPQDIIDKAENYAYNNNNEIDLTLEKLINQSATLEKKLNEIRDKDYRLSKKLEEVNKIKERTAIEKNKVLEEASIQADEIIKNAMKQIDSLMEELQEMKNRDIKHHEIATLKHKVKELKDSTNIKMEVIPNNTEIKVGDRVFIESYNTSGEVIKINKNRYDVSVGNATITVKKDDIRLTNQDVPVQLVKTTHQFAPRKTVKLSLDLRGMRYEDAEGLIDDYLYDAYYAGLNQVSIIHGFGTGVIRELVQNKLRNNHNVASFRYGGQNEGGQGATIITLKEK